LPEGKKRETGVRVQRTTYFLRNPPKGRNSDRDVKRRLEKAAERGFVIWGDKVEKKRKKRGSLLGKESRSYEQTEVRYRS